MSKAIVRRFIADPDFSPCTFGEKLLAGFLSLVSFFYAWGVDFRNWAYRRGIFRIRKLPRPVISVGNLTVGGTGKTPLVAWLARYLSEKGFIPCILSRGYRREEEGKILLLEGGAGSYDYKKLGDEPALLAQKLPGALLALGAERYRAAEEALRKFSIDLFILDDGFQHQRLHRDLNILLLDSANPWGNGCLFPRGSLREPKKTLSRADWIILTHAEEIKDYEKLKQEVRRYNSEAPLMVAGYKSRTLGQINGSLELTPDELFDKNVLAFAGLAQPQSFQRTLHRLGAKIIKLVSYADHHPYSREDIIQLVRTAEAAEVDFIVTTEKDAVRLMGMDLPCPFWALRVEMEIFEGWEQGETRLKNLMVGKN